MNQENYKIGGGYALICLLWGSTWLAIRLGLDSLSPIFSAGLRFSLAALLFFLVMKLKGLRLQTDKISVMLYLVMGLFSFVIPFGLVYWAEQFIPSGLTSVLFAIFPFMVLIFSRLIKISQSIETFQLMGTILSFSGIIVIFSEDLAVDISEDFWGMLAIFLSSTIQAGVTVTIKKYGKHLNPISMNFIPLVIAGFVMVVGGLIFENIANNVYDHKAILSIIYLACFGTVLTFTTYYWLMKKINVVILSLLTFITPIIALILGWVVLGETLSTRTFIGSSLVLTGILFANLKGMKNYLSARAKHSQ